MVAVEIWVGGVVGGAAQNRCDTGGARRGAVGVHVPRAATLRVPLVVWWLGVGVGAGGVRVTVTGMGAPGAGSFWPGHVASTRPIASFSAWVTHSLYLVLTATWRAT